MDKSDWKPCFGEKTWKYGFSKSRLLRMELGRLGWITSRRSSHAISVPLIVATPSVLNSLVVCILAFKPVFSMKNFKRAVLRSISFSGCESRMANSSSW